ncbi:TRAP transporter solute receptor, TAXI family, putative [Synechococcus sp. PCC 7335]|uniref:TAXI family TRAP transporter solute-binding subunit n=1 Tax=Synechococcus sp. (strain ATCC 29403 / PCC 7335) TaxID=91464 RepID=UPI00017EC796|nr:TAXI family TRAP transporter solute-binding subunit [Synechococcus sp. PCC 7335]EDX86128.1 TRAP transporter solute receptor, TAXI family, putative [Synechococcus sp. PCC 7335]
MSLLARKVLGTPDGRQVLRGVLVGVSIAATVVCAGLWLRTRNQVHHITFATGGETGEYYAFGRAIAQVTQKHAPNIQIEVVASVGSAQNMDSVQRRTADLALVQSDTPVQPAVTAVAQLYPEMFHLIARKTANVQTLRDLQGKRIALMPVGSGSYQLFWPLAAHYGLSDQDLEARPMPAKAAHAALRAGEVDVLFRIIGLGNPSVAELFQGDQLELVEISQLGALQLAQPFLESTVIPQGSYSGSQPIPPIDLPVIAVSALLVANEKVNPDIIKTITSVLYEHRNELIALTPRAASIQSPERSQNLGFPLHPGASAYYRQDTPSFVVRYAEAMGFLLSLSFLTVSSIWQFRQWLIGRQKNRADDYNLEILALIEQLEQAETLSQLQALRQQLFSILRQVVIDLDVDKISPESFQSFTFPWEVAMTTLHHQELVLHQVELTGQSRD